MADSGPDNEISDRAAEWAVAMALDDMTPARRADLDAWLAADRRHRGAYARACAWLRATEDAVVDAYVTAASPASARRPCAPVNDNGPAHAKAGLAPLHHGLLQWGGRAAAACAALAISTAALIAVGAPFSAPSDPAGPAAARIVRLADGSVARLGTGARIEARMADDIRKIILLSGEARFEVAKDKRRPFVVRSGAVYAQATGTIYSVRRIGPTGGTVTVAEGSVLVWPRDERDQAVLLHAGGRVTLDPGPGRAAAPARATAPPRLPPPELAQISLDNVSVDSAVARFNRVNATRIVVADPAIGAIRIIGLYRADDPDQFAQAVAAISGAIIENRKGIIVIKMK